MEVAGFAEQDVVKEIDLVADGAEGSGGGVNVFTVLSFDAGLDGLFTVGDGDADGFAGFEAEAAEGEEATHDVVDAGGDFDFFVGGGGFDEVFFGPEGFAGFGVEGDAGFFAAIAFFGDEGAGFGAEVGAEEGAVVIVDAEEAGDEAGGFEVEADF